MKDYLYVVSPPHTPPNTTNSYYTDIPSRKREILLGSLSLLHFKMLSSSQIKFMASDLSVSLQNSFPPKERMIFPKPKGN